MKCFKCGAQMAPGQKICSICDADNSKQIYENTPSYDYEKTNYDYKEENNNNSVEEEEKSSSKWFSIIVIILVFIIMILGIKYTLNYLNKESDNEEVVNKDIFKVYKKIKEDIIIKDNLGEEITCDDNCNVYYDYDEDLYSLTIDEDEENYIIILVDNINEIDQSLCNSEIECDNNSIKGYIKK